jgi:hypothetical protein
MINPQYLLKYRSIDILSDLRVFQKRAIFVDLAKNLFINGRLAQLVQSACLTSKMSGVRIPHCPQAKFKMSLAFLLAYILIISAGSVSAKLTDDTSKLNMHVIYESAALRDQALKLPFAQDINMAHNRLQDILSKLK